MGKINRAEESWQQNLQIATSARHIGSFKLPANIDFNADIVLL